MFCTPGGPTLDKSDVVSWDDSAAFRSPLANIIEERHALANERNDLASPAGAVEPACLAARWESLQLPVSVTNTFLEARTPSTRGFYSIKWSVFSALDAAWIHPLVT